MNEEGCGLAVARERIDRLWSNSAGVRERIRPEGVP
jgi:hypothetical protein